MEVLAFVVGVGLVLLLFWVILKSIIMTDEWLVGVEAKRHKETCPMCERVVTTDLGEDGDMLDWHHCSRCGDYATFKDK